MKSNLPPPPQPLHAVELKVKNGALWFENSNDFKNTIAYFHSIGVDKAKELIVGLPNFKGLVEITPNDKEDIIRLHQEMWDRNSRIILSDYDPSIDDVAPPEALEYDDYLVQDPILEICLNNYREVMIGDYFIRMTERGVFSYQPSQRSYFESQYGTDVLDKALLKVYTSEDAMEFDLPQVLPNVYVVNRDKDLFDASSLQQWSLPCNGSGQLGTNPFGQLTDCDIPIDSRRRYRATVWSQNTGLYSSIGFKTRRQTRFLGIWWNAEGERLAVEGEGEYYTKWPAGIPMYYTYNRVRTKVDLPGVKDVTADLPQPYHTAEVNFAKLKIKPAKKYTFKKHESDHYGWINGVRHHRKIKHN